MRVKFQVRVKLKGGLNLRGYGILPLNQTHFVCYIVYFHALVYQSYHTAILLSTKWCHLRDLFSQKSVPFFRLR